MNIAIILSKKSTFKLEELVKDCNETLEKLGCKEKITPEKYLSSLINQTYYQMKTTK